MNERLTIVSDPHPGASCLSGHPDVTSRQSTYPHRFQRPQTHSLLRLNPSEPLSLHSPASRRKIRQLLGNHGIKRGITPHESLSDVRFWAAARWRCGNYIADRLKGAPEVGYIACRFSSCILRAQQEIASLERTDEDLTAQARNPNTAFGPRSRTTSIHNPGRTS